MSANDGLPEVVPQTQANAEATQATAQPAAESHADPVSPEQYIAGVEKFYTSFRRAEIAYRLFNDAAHGRRKLPIFQCVIDGVPLEVDFHAPTARIRDENVQDATRKAMLGPMSNHYAAIYTQELRQLALYSLNSWKLLSGEDNLTTIPGVGFDELVARIHAAYQEFEPIWKSVKSVWDAVKGGKAIATLGDLLNVDLMDLLQQANLSEEQSKALIGKFVQTRITELQKRAIPCLREIASAAGTAVQQIDRNQQQKTSA